VGVAKIRNILGCNAIHKARSLDVLFWEGILNLLLRRMGWQCCQLVICASYLMGTVVQAGEAGTIKPTQARFVTTYESVKLPGNEKMGLLGGAILFDVRDWLSVGGGAYGALAGQRGGFITLGLATELHQQIGEHVEINAGLFVGAGGGRGGFTLQGGGLMLRTHMGATLKLGEYGGIGAGASWVDFPNGSIHSVQPYVSYMMPFSTLMPSGWVDFPEGENVDQEHSVRTAEQEFSVVYRRYRIPSGVLTDTGTPQYNSMGLAGVEWHRYLDEHFFLKVESEGAMQGKSNGYMQILAGAGYRQPLTSSTSVKLSAALGPAGGGGVATGGGILLDAQLTLQQMLGEHLFVEAGAGYVKAPGGSFRAASASGMVGYRFSTPDVADEPISIVDLAGFDARHFRIRLVNQRYLKGAPNWRSHHANLNVDLLGFQMDYFINDWFYLSGQGIGAYKGKGGGYMTGLVGGGVRLPIPGTPLFVEGDALVGAAGGGGLDVAGGLVWQADAGIGWQISDAYSLQAFYGIMQAPKGNFKAKVLSLSLGYYFSLPTM